jgi:hypothetical protein
VQYTLCSVHCPGGERAAAAESPEEGEHRLTALCQVITRLLFTLPPTTCPPSYYLSSILLLVLPPYYLSSIPTFCPPQENPQKEKTQLPTQKRSAPLPSFSQVHLYLVLAADKCEGSPYEEMALYYPQPNQVVQTSCTARIYTESPFIIPPSYNKNSIRKM